jgi:carbonic anhydrase
MTNIDHLLDRNRPFARTDARRDVPALPFLPRQGLYIVICIDCRVDPAQILGIELGDTLVQRNIGGRVTPAVIRNIAYAAYLVETKAPRARGSRSRSFTTPTADRPCWPTTSSATATRSGSASMSGPWPTRRVLDPARTVRTDVQRVLWAVEIPPHVQVSGHVYDVETGLVTTVVDAKASRQPA